MLHRCRMDGGQETLEGYCKQRRPLVTDIPKLDLPKRLPPDNFYEPEAEAATSNQAEPMKRRLIRGQALTAMPCYRRIHTLSATGANAAELNAKTWLALHGMKIDLDLDADPDLMLSYEELRLRVVNDPVGQCVVVELLLRLFVLRILGAAPDAVAQPEGITVEHRVWTSDGVAASLTSLGCLVMLQAARGELEASGRGALHGHWEIWGAATSNQAEPMKRRLIRGQALTAMPSYRRIHTLSADAANAAELNAKTWLALHVEDAWQVQARAMLHVCGPSCWKHNKTGTRVCRHHCYHITLVEPDATSATPGEKPLKIRREGRPLNNQLYIIGESGKGKRGRVEPIVVMPFETLTNYVAACSLRCNFDNQSLVDLPPASTLPLEWMPNIGPKPQ
eukprot:s1119_g1.t1